MDLSTFSVEQALKLTKHSKTSRDALRMSKPTFWKSVFRSTHVVWANFKGKSIQSYACRVAIKKRFHFQCNCSSKQQPCRHALALLILLVEKPKAFKPKALPAELASWWDSLPETTEDPKPAPKQIKSQGKSSLPKRLSKMKSGAIEVETWIHDALRQGFGQFSGETGKSFEGVRQRMTDAGLGGLRSHIDEIEEVLNQSADWPDLIHQPFSHLQSLIKGLTNFDDLSPTWQKEVLNQCGVYIRRSELDELPIIEEYWTSLWSQISERSDGGYQRSTWLFGQQSKRFALLLEYNYREAKFLELPESGRWFQAALTYYPSPYPQRAIMRWSGSAGMPLQQLPAEADFLMLQQNFKNAILANPWQRRIPTAIDGLSFMINDQGRVVANDRLGNQLLVRLDEAVKWQLLALAMDYPQEILLVAEFDGIHLMPLGILINKQYFTLEQAYQPSDS